MKIIINQKPYDDYYDDEDCFNYEVNAQFITNPSTTMPSCVKMFVQACLLEGYMESSINRAMKEYLDENCDEDDLKKLVLEYPESPNEECDY